LSAGDRVAADVRVLRVLKDKPFHVAPATRTPTPAAFEPSSADLAHPPVRVSVWDERVTVRRAVELRGGGELVTFCVAVAMVDHVAADLGNERLRVVEDPEGAIGCAPDDARWHHGIEGLEKAAWTDRARRLEALARIALACASAV